LNSFQRRQLVQRRQLEAIEELLRGAVLQRPTGTFGAAGDAHQLVLPAACAASVRPDAAIASISARMTGCR